MQPNGQFYSAAPAQTDGGGLFKKILFLGIGLAVLLIIGFTIFNMLKVTDEDSARSFATLVQDKDVEKSYALTSESFRNTTSKDEWGKTLERINPFIKGELESVDLGAAANTYKFLPKDGKYILTVSLSKETGKALVTFFSSELYKP